MLPELLPEQQELLVAMVEAARGVPRQKRHPFMLLRSMRGDSLLHNGFPNRSHDMFVGDFVALQRAGLLHHINKEAYDVAPQGYSYYKELKRRSGDPVERVTSDVRRYLDSGQFEKRHPIAHAKWSQAEALLWGDDAPGQLTAIGHHCREAVQAFATELVNEFKPPQVDPDPQHEIRRVEAVLKHRAQRLGETEGRFLDALFHYWRTLSALVQRQEHGATRNKEDLRWEDARRLIYQTANVMYEIDRSLIHPR